MWQFLAHFKALPYHIATLRWSGEEGQQPPTKDQESFRQLGSH